MAEITFRIPSKAVTYGYVEIPVTLTDDPAPEALASMYVNYVYAFQREEQAALKRIAEGPSREQINQVMSDEDIDTEAEAVAIIKDGLGATEVDEAAKPWDQAVDAKLKPWETEVTAPAVLDAAW